MTETRETDDDLNFDNICRLCLAADKTLSNIFDGAVSQSSESTLADKIFYSTTLQVNEEDGLPLQVCEGCKELVNALHTFKRQCITSDVTLRKCLRRRNPNFEVKGEPANDGATVSNDEATDGSESRDCIPIASTKFHTRQSPSPNSDWDCEAVDVEVKVEITENFDEPIANSTARKRLKRGENEKMTDFKDAFPCSQCDKVFAHKNSMTRHELSHTNEKFSCFYCGKFLTTRDTLLRHVKAHTGEKRYKCEHCGKSYTSSTSYSSHIRKHTGERPYKCPECKESFSLSSSYERHLAKHKGTKEFVCEVCGSSFWVADDLRSHVNRVH